MMIPSPAPLPDDETVSSQIHFFIATLLLPLVKPSALLLAGSRGRSAIFSQRMAALE
jgi:hypothetical protein